MTRALLALACAGCVSLAPAYERPLAPVPAQLAGGQGNARAADLPLDQFVREPRLRQILARAIAANRSLRRAVLDIEAARQQYRIQRAARLPSIDGAVGVTEARQFTGFPGMETVDFTLYSASIGLASWEVDLFGKLKNLADAKMQAYLATIESARFAQISLIAEIATAYVTIAADRSRLIVARDTMTTAQKAMELTEQLVGGGTSNRSDYWQAATIFQTARGDVALLTAAIAQDRNALELLAGGPIEDSLLPDALPPQLDWFSDVPVGLSSAVLLERPDVLAAEHDLIAANANIGAARAALFPDIELTASGGIVSLALKTLFSAPTAIWSLAPSLVLPIFHGGALRANVAYTRVQKESLVAAYELAIQSAFREVADALATRATIDEQLAAQVALVNAATKGFELSQARYKAGIENFLATLVSERSLYTAQGSLIATQLSAMANRIALYRALGGGLK